MPKHQQRLHLGINLGAEVYLLLCIGPIVDKLEDATGPANVATPTQLPLDNPTLPNILISLGMLLPPPITLNGIK